MWVLPGAYQYHAIANNQTPFPLDACKPHILPTAVCTSHLLCGVGALVDPLAGCGGAYVILSTTFLALCRAFFTFVFVSGPSAEVVRGPFVCRRVFGPRGSEPVASDVRCCCFASCNRVLGDDALLEEEIH